MSTQATLGIPVCPECSNSISNLKQLYRTRRSRCLAVVAMLLLCVGVGFTLAPTIRRDGWARVAPVTVLILLVPSIDATTDSVFVELNSRWPLEKWDVELDQPMALPLWSWQERLLAWRCRGPLEPSGSVVGRRFAFEVLAHLGASAKPALNELRRFVQSNNQDTYSALTVLEAIGPDARSCAPDLIELLKRATEDDWWQSTAIRALGHYGTDAAGAVQALNRIIEKPPQGDGFFDRDLIDEAVRTLGKIGPDAEPAIPALIQILDNVDQRCRADAARSIWQIAPHRADCRLALLKALNDEEATVRSSAAELIRQNFQLMNQAIEQSANALRDSSPAVRIGSARALMTLGPSSSVAARALQASLSDQEPLVRLFSLRALMTTSQHASLTQAQIARLLNDRDVIVKTEAQRLFSNPMMEAR